MHGYYFYWEKMSKKIAKWAKKIAKWAKFAVFIWSLFYAHFKLYLFVFWVQKQAILCHMNYRYENSNEQNNFRHESQK